ncbi:LysR family transcriptional regulator [Burkholderia cepacia]|uniref:LysR family transcriptional regulator n=1 Tax=Burkholderia cepacia TaxID=292 RepID=UPI00075F58CF|nr:LysR family transcriptional regulator [Burkholderia cepacia]KVR68989.1 LysR family transcriptional regulator [Burkholderia cepacia]KWE18316.1 LysR family transcriptional regulator [Burkholderia cepacia]
MLTFKQMEALYWIVQLGSFDAAASKLNASQSAISKRIQELEGSFDLAVFDRTQRTARLTEKGEEMFLLAKELLERRDQIVEQISAKDVLVRRLRLGVTELTALTWLPRLIAAIKDAYPKVIVEAEVELSSTLRDRLSTDTLDFVVAPKSIASERFVSTPLASVENAWMCVPEMVPGRRPIRLHEMGQFPLLMQGKQSGTGLTYGQFLQENGVTAPKLLSSNNLVAQIGLTLSGIGVSYLPQACLQHLVDEGLLGIIRTTPPLPPVEYVALYRSDRPFGLNSEIAKLAAATCDFSSLLLAPRTATRKAARKRL